MGWWDGLGRALEEILDESGMPLGTGIRAVTGWGAGHPAAPAPSSPSGPPPPGMPGAPGGVSDMILGNLGVPPGAAAPGQPAGDPPAPPPAPPGDPSGQAASAAAGNGQQVGATVEQLAELDKSAQATLTAIQAAGQAGRQQLDQIQAQINDKITALGPRLNTPQGQAELRDFLKDKLTAAKAVIDKTADDAATQAGKTKSLTAQYAGLGKPGDPPEKPDQPGKSGKPGDPGLGGAGTTPGGAGTTPATTQPAAAAVPAGGFPFAGGGFPGFGGGGFPGFGGGFPGLPGFGGGEGDPLGVGAAGHGQTVGVDSPGEHGHDDDPKHHDVVGVNPSDKKGDQFGGTQPAGVAGTTGTDQHPDTPPDTTGAATHETGTDVKLADGTIAHARTGQGATAVRAVLGGASVADGYKQADITLPPPGTPVTDPVPPAQLKAGDVGYWKDHLVMALGGGKVIVNGQVQPQDSVGSGPDFLGWIDPTKGKAAPQTVSPPSGESP